MILKSFDIEAQPYEIPPPRLESRVHPLGHERIQAETDEYFDKSWQFESEKEKRGFFIVGLSRAYSLIFSFTLDDRVNPTNKMHYLALLVDDKLEKMSSAEMVSYNRRLIDIMHGNATPDNTVPVERILHETVQLMKGFDEALANDVVDGFTTLLRTQANPERLRIKHLGPYLECRMNDIGKPFYTALLRFGAALHLTPEELTLLDPLEQNAFKHVGVLNDIYSWKRELKVYEADGSDGSLPFSAVRILALETGLSYSAC